MYVLESTTGRRRFLKGAGAATIAAAAAGAAGAACAPGEAPMQPAAVTAAAAEWGRDAGEWIPSACMMCGGQ